MIKYAFAVATLPLCALAVVSRAQMTGRPNGAFLSSTVNAAALEPSARVTVALTPYVPGGVTAGVGVRLGSGSLHTLVRMGDERGLNVGYAQILGAHGLPLWLGASVGIDATGGILRERNAERTTTSYAARVSVPFALRWDTPVGFAAAAYAAPYGELGRAPRYAKDGCSSIFGCGVQYQGVYGTGAAGVGAGVRLTAWRFGVEVGVRDVALRNRRFVGVDGSSAMLTFRF